MAGGNLDYQTTLNYFLKTQLSREPGRENGQHLNFIYDKPIR